MRKHEDKQWTIIHGYKKVTLTHSLTECCQTGRVIRRQISAAPALEFRAVALGIVLHVHSKKKPGICGGRECKVFRNSEGQAACCYCRRCRRRTLVRRNAWSGKFDAFESSMQTQGLGWHSGCRIQQEIAFQIFKCSWLSRERCIFSAAGTIRRRSADPFFKCILDRQFVYSSPGQSFSPLSASSFKFLTASVLFPCPKDRFWWYAGHKIELKRMMMTHINEFS